MYHPLVIYTHPPPTIFDLYQKHLLYIKQGRGIHPINSKFFFVCVLCQTLYKNKMPETTYVPPKSFVYERRFLPWAVLLLTKSLIILQETKNEVPWLPCVDPFKNRVKTYTNPT